MNFGRENLLAFIVILLAAARVPAADPKEERVPVLISTTNQKMIVRTTSKGIFWFQICDFEGNNLITNRDFIDYLRSNNRAASVCENINEAIFATTDGEVVDSINRKFTESLERIAEARARREAGYRELAQGTVLTASGALLGWIGYNKLIMGRTNISESPRVARRMGALISLVSLFLDWQAFEKMDSAYINFMAEPSVTIESAYSYIEMKNAHLHLEKSGELPRDQNLRRKFLRAIFEDILKAVDEATDAVYRDRSTA